MKQKTKKKVALVLIAIVFAIMVSMVLGVFNPQTTKASKTRATNEESILTQEQVEFVPSEGKDAEVIYDQAGRAVDIPSLGISFTVPEKLTFETTTYKDAGGERSIYLVDENGKNAATIKIAGKQNSKMAFPAGFAETNINGNTWMAKESENMSLYICNKTSLVYVYGQGNEDDVNELLNSFMFK